ncbi:MAG: hypothetical protein ABJN42_13620 [Roseibium sp.]|uniref:hypothetical protein n=1 Tax=Roseibium sp. TaxID=1936156 RepID=UPI003298F9A7
MKIEEAEQIIINTKNQFLIGSIISELAVATPQIVYRSADIIANVGNDLLASVQLIGTWDLVRQSEGQNIEARFGLDVQGEKINIFALCSHANLGPGYAAREGDLGVAIETLKAQETMALRKSLGRLVDAAGGLLIVDADGFMDRKGDGPSILARGVVQETAPETTYRFSAVMMHVGKPDKVHLAQIQVARKGGHETEPGSNPFRYTHGFEMNPDYVPM